MLKNSGVLTIEGFGRLISPTEVQVGDVVYQAKHILIAVGGAPVLPDITGIELAIQSDQLFGLAELRACWYLVAAISLVKWPVPIISLDQKVRFGCA